MTKVNQRGWKPINEDCDEDFYDKVKPVADALASEWSRLHHEEEQRGFMRDFDREDGLYDGAEPEEVLYYETMERVNREQKRRNIEAIEEELEKLGVRMMGPYEHWNEDAKYMEYMERDR